MKTVPLHGKKARGRVALVDDEDYELVSQYRWFVYEKPPTDTTRGCGPYATANVGHGRSNRRSIRMHVLIMGRPYIDHVDHDGLNNQRYNLRSATYPQNGQNQRSQQNATSQYKGVIWVPRKRKWTAQIAPASQSTHLGYFYSEIEAAYAYDAAARAAFGEFACTNFPEPPTRAMQDDWQAARASVAAERISARNARHSEWMAQLEPQTRICTVCGDEYQTKALRPTLYCGTRCNATAKRRRKQERELGGRLS